MGNGGNPSKEIRPEWTVSSRKLRRQLEAVDDLAVQMFGGNHQDSGLQYNRSGSI